MDMLSADDEVIKEDIAHRSFRRVAFDKGYITFVRCSDIAEGDILYQASGCLAVFLIFEDTQRKQTTCLDMINGDILKEDIADDVIIAGYDRHTPLVVELAFSLVHDADIAEDEVFDGVDTGSIIAFGSRAMQSNEDRMGYLGIEDAVFDEDMPR